MRKAQRPEGPAKQKRTLVVGLIAVAVAIICGLPHILNCARLDEEYTPFAVVGASPVVFDETIAYAPRVKEVLEGNYLSGNVHGFEYKDQPSRALPFLLPTMVLAILARLLGGSVAHAFIGADFIFPFLAIICAYFVARNLKASVPAALCAAVLVVLGTDLIELPLVLIKAPAATRASRLLGPHGPRPLEFSRTFVPQCSYLMVLCAVLVLQRALALGRWPHMVAAGVVAGLLFYTYTYSWPYFLLAAAACALWFIAAGDKWSAKCLAGVIVVALIVGGPVLLSIILSSLGGPSPDLIRYGLGITALPWGAQKQRLLFTLLIVLLYPRTRSEYPIVVTFLVAPFVCILGSQLTGMRLQEWHWIARDWTPWAVLCIPLLLDVRVQRYRRLLNVIWVALALLVAAYAVNKQYRWAAYAAEHHVMGHDRAQGIQWLRKNAPAGSVVIGLDFDMLGLLPVYTNCNLYLPFSVLTPARTEEMLQRFAHTCAVLGLDKRDMFAILGGSKAERGLLSASQLRGHYWVFTLGRPRFTITTQDMHVLSQAWERVSQHPGPEGLPFRADYIWVHGRGGRRSGSPPPGWIEAWTGQSAIIYRPGRTPSAMARLSRIIAAFGARPAQMGGADEDALRTAPFSRYLAKGVLGWVYRNTRRRAAIAAVQAALDGARPNSDHFRGFRARSVGACDPVQRDSARPPSHTGRTGSLQQVGDSRRTGVFRPS